MLCDAKGCDRNVVIYYDADKPGKGLCFSHACDRAYGRKLEYKEEVVDKK